MGESLDGCGVSRVYYLSPFLQKESALKCDVHHALVCDWSVIFCLLLDDTRLCSIVLLNCLIMQDFRLLPGNGWYECVAAKKKKKGFL